MANQISKEPTQLNKFMDPKCAIRIKGLIDQMAKEKQGKYDKIMKKPNQIEIKSGIKTVVL